MSKPTCDDIAALLASLKLIVEATYSPTEMAALEWRDKVVPPILPNMSSEQIDEMLKGASGNGWIKRMVALWEELGSPGRVQVRKSSTEGRSVHVMGLRPLAEGWQDIPTLITDATADPVLLRYIWPDLKCEVETWEQLPRPASVRVFQTVDRSQSMDRIGVFGEREKLERRRDAARRVWATLLARALEYGGQPVGVIVYKSTRDWIEKNCFKPDWITLLHHGGVAGVNTLEWVRALFVVGRLLPDAEAVSKMTEALTGEYLPERKYQRRMHEGRILIPMTSDGFRYARSTSGSIRTRSPSGSGGRPPRPAPSRPRAGLGRLYGTRIHHWTSIAGMTCRCRNSAKSSRCCGTRSVSTSTG